MRTHNLGYPRIGSKRELKKSSEAYWAGKIRAEELLLTGKKDQAGKLEHPTGCRY